MEGYIYPASLIVVAAFVFTFYRNKSTILMIVSLLVGVYVVYSHETGYSSTTLKQQISDTIDSSVKDYDKSKKMGLVKEEGSVE